MKIIGDNKMIMMLLNNRRSSFMMFCMILMIHISIVISLKQLFVTPGQTPVVCTDSRSNVCTAPTSCAALGETNFTTGTNLYYDAVKQQDGLYIITGGYTIEFPIQCNITCTGNCSCTNCKDVIVFDDSGSGGSTSSSIYITYLIGMSWTLLVLFVSTSASLL